MGRLRAAQGKTPPFQGHTVGLLLRVLLILDKLVSLIPCPSLLYTSRKIPFNRTTHASPQPPESLLCGPLGGGWCREVTELGVGPIHRPSHVGLCHPFSVAADNTAHSLLPHRLFPTSLHPTVAGWGALPRCP